VAKGNKKSPELVREIVKNWPAFKAPKAFIVFKRWDKLTGEDNPEVVIFFAKPDVLAGLFTLANFDESHPEGVFTPMGSGCSSIITYPYLEKDLPHPRRKLPHYQHLEGTSEKNRLRSKII